MDKEKIIQELRYKAVRSSGPGGQHANKVSSKIELYFEIDASQGLSHQEKERLRLKLNSRLTSERMLKLYCAESRSQHKNKDIVTKRFFEILKKALHIPKKRKPTKPSKSSVEKRLQSKRRQSGKKLNRKRPDLE